MNWVQFKDPASHMCLAGSTLTLEVAGLSPFTVMTNIFVTEFRETFKENSTEASFHVLRLLFNCNVALLKRLKITLFPFFETKCGKSSHFLRSHNSEVFQL